MNRSHAVPLALAALLAGHATVASPAPTVPPAAATADCSARECRYFHHYFVAANGPAHEAEFAETYGTVRSEWEKLHQDRPGISLGAMLAIVVYESGARMDFFNTRDKENSFKKQLDPSRPYTDQPLAYYSYQLGVVPIHTSLVRPCMAATDKMRRLFDQVAKQQGFDPTPQELESVRPRWQVACSSVLRPMKQPGPQPVDYYVLQSHAAPFGVPVDGASSRRAPLPSASLKAFPFFSPRVTSPMLFAAIASSKTRIENDGDTITAFGGGDAHYASPATHDAMLASWQHFH